MVWTFYISQRSRLIFRKSIRRCKTIAAVSQPRNVARIVSALLPPYRCDKSLPLIAQADPPSATRNAKYIRVRFREVRGGNRKNSRVHACGATTRDLSIVNTIQPFCTRSRRVYSISIYFQPRESSLYAESMYVDRTCCELSRLCTSQLANDISFARALSRMRTNKIPFRRFALLYLSDTTDNSALSPCSIAVYRDLLSSRGSSIPRSSRSRGNAIHASIRIPCVISFFFPVNFF